MSESTRLRAPDGTRGEAGIRLHVVLPALNEERTIGDVIRAIPRELPGVDRVEVVVVNDGSTDSTAQRARQAGARVLNHRTPRGVGAAFQSALDYCIARGADLIVSIDADGQFDPADIPLLAEPILAGEADLATASRFKDPSLTPKMPRVKRWGNRVMSRLISRLTGETFFDVSCGFRCYSRHAAMNLHLMGRFTYTQEVFMNLAFRQFGIIEVPLRVRGVRAHGRSKVAGSVVRYALRASRIIFRCYRDYFPLRFFGAIGMMLILPAVASGLFLLWHYVTTGGFSPHKWAGFAGGALLVLGLIMLHIGMIGDMLARHRTYLEEILFRQRAESRSLQ